jgi:hypothetical protein
MKKIGLLVLTLFALNTHAFWNNNNTPWNSFNGYVEDNGIFGFNPYEWTDPRWYPEEMSNLMDEFDDEFGGNNWGNNSNYNPYYNPYNNRYNPNPYNQNPYNNFNKNFNNIPRPTPAK